MATSSWLKEKEKANLTSKWSGPVIDVKYGHFTLLYIIIFHSLLEVGQACVLNLKPPFTASLQKATHVFVEKALEKEVKCFADAGIPCLSPDYIPEYILQVLYI